MAFVSALGAPQETGMARKEAHTDSAILPGMPKTRSIKRERKPRIAIVGAGNLAGALAVALHQAGYVIDQIVTRGRAESSMPARQLAREVGAIAVTARRAQLRADLVWFCVPDRAIAGAASAMKEATEWRGKVALHSSGALTSDELVELRRRGAQVASVHPLMTFVHGSRPLLVGVPFSIEGDSRAVRAARALVRDLRGQPFSIRKRHKQAYHAWGMFVSPLLTALLAAGEHVAVAAGVRRGAAKQRMLPILRQTLANYAALGAPQSFSGPIARGDAETIKKHLSALRTVPEEREVYLALARAALRDLPAKNRAALEKILKR
jgi:predicted short-subunit dehydrogenase-like oxidoreductase (DUF2520 family)